MSPGSKAEAPLAEQGRLAGRSLSLRVRARMIQAIRRFFIRRDYLEVETPCLLPAPAPEIHINPIPAGELFLQPSPELCMKRLLAAGFPRVFQIAKCFRAEERGDLHLPEFTMLEWYRTGIEYKALMEECETLILSVSRDLGMGKEIRYQGREIHLASPWKRRTVHELFKQHTFSTPEQALERGCFDEMLTGEIEPHLGSHPIFVHDFPAPLASLARLKHDDDRVAERFELYLGGLEIANGFTELTDPVEQRSRFEKDQAERLHLGKQVYPMPNRFLRSLEDMPDAAGIALGVDRLAMIFTDKAKIDHVVTFAPEEA